MRQPILLLTTFVVVAVGAAGAYWWISRQAADQAEEAIYTRGLEVLDPLARPYEGAQLTAWPADPEREPVAFRSDARGWIALPAETAFQRFELVAPGCQIRRWTADLLPESVLLELGLRVQVRVTYPIDLRQRELRWVVRIFGGADPEAPTPVATRASLLGPFEGERPAPEIGVDPAAGIASFWVSEPGTYEVELGLARRAGGEPEWLLRQPITVDQVREDPVHELRIDPAAVTRAVQALAARD